ncbi:hypothetical protein [Acetivibrio mesophilus]|uniref:Uncharacterized protein n=1 Tax=Acetivibrio mesophilus TaxID=2487273 RepID=A0A4Q0I0N5_9FIRM|nr:hypothetical protein [Acetivibrio mesophilus]ODM27975.1 hypothetical protein A7W90_18170 [Clostridium sp. Bc-iso-3]RXE57784.1 hypothetical protein EFD62_15810 [Acetivibrio mesophilus]
MDYTYPSIGFNLMSLKNFQDRGFATKVIYKINEYGKDFIPQKFDIYQPLKRKYNPNNVSEVIDVWMNDTINQECSKDEYAEGLLLMKATGRSKASYMVNWKKDNVINFNTFSCSVNIEYVKYKDNLDKFINLCKELIDLIEPVHGKIVNESFAGAFEPVELTIRHPELQWMNFFGKPYINLFGREKLLSVPAHNVESIGDKVIAIQTTDNIFEPIPNDIREKIKKHLGENAFVWDGKRALVYKNKEENIVPKFDFSEVLFDKTKPIIEPQIRIRKRN